MLRGVILTEKVYEDDDTMAFLDTNPSAPGHTIVIPKYHKSNILELDEHELVAVFKTVQKVTEKIRKNMKPDGFNIGINHGNVAGQRIPHFHVHIIPRFKDDKGGMIQMVVSNKPKEDLAAIASKIRGGEEIPDFIIRQIKDYDKEQEKVKEEEKPQNKEEEKMEKMEKKLFPSNKVEFETEETEKEDVYDKMLKRMRIAN